MPSYQLKTLKNGLRVIEAMNSAEAREFTSAQIEKATGLSKNSVFWILKTLVESGFVIECNTGYLLGPALIRLSEIYRLSLEHRRTSLDAEEKEYLGDPKL